MHLALVLFAAGVAASPAPRFAAGHAHLTVNGAPLVIRGVNLGAARPGERPTDHAVDRATFERWFARMSELQINTVRVFDLQPPAFYQALAAHNRGRRSPLYLLQGIWLDTPERPGDLWAAGVELDRRSAEAIDALHGRAEIARRRFRASGRYRADVSAWTLGLIIGREIEPAEIAATNAAHPARTSLRGAFLDVARGNPAEVWLAARLDAAIAHEARRYRTSRPVAAVSWPPLDPLEHPSAEPGMDRVAIDITKIDRRRAPSGLFAAYSIYPYYPRFIWRETAHRRATDDDGANPYLGYLRRLVAHYRGLPLVVAEYGVPSSPAVVSRDPIAGMSFGGADEADQARVNRRLRRSIESAGCAGGVAFAWLDEWWKPTWILRGRSDPERYPLWHDRISPEQNFGMISFEADNLRVARTRFDGPIAAIDLAANPGFFEIGVTLARPDEVIEIGIDLGVGVGLSQLPGGQRLAVPAQLAVVIEGRSAELRVAAGSDLSGIAGQDGWRPWRWKTPAIETPGELGTIDRSGGQLRLRLPWSLLQVSDPGRRRVALPGGGATSPGIAVVVAAGDLTVRTRRYIWPGWDRAPSVREREKPASRLYVD